MSERDDAIQRWTHWVIGVDGAPSKDTAEVLLTEIADLRRQLAEAKARVEALTTVLREARGQLALEAGEAGWAHPTIARIDAALAGKE